VKHLCISTLDGFILNSGTKALPDLLINDEVQPRTKPAHRLVVFKGRQVTKAADEAILGYFLRLFVGQAITAAMSDDGVAIESNKLNPCCLVIGVSNPIQQLMVCGVAVHGKGDEEWGRDRPLG
jgi:hypothetical protein